MAKTRLNGVESETNRPCSEMKLEMLPVPVSDVVRARAFYVDTLGFTFDYDMRPADTALMSRRVFVASS